MHSIMSFSEDFRSTPIPSTCLLGDPPILTNHRVALQPSSSFVVNLTTKLARAWALSVVLGQYCTSNSLSSIVYRTNCLAASGLFIALSRGLSVWTIMMYAWKYGLSLQVDVIRAKANFSIGGYVPFVPLRTWLV